MKHARRLLAVVLSALLLLGMITVPASAEFIDVNESTKHNEAIDILVALKMLKGYEDGSFRPDNTITRAEFATVVARMLGLESVAVSASAKDVFTDMTVGGGEHWASGYIKIAYNLGIILGMGDGTFAPDNPVTYEQAIKMMVCALGYDAAALELGGWPDGYLAQAAELELTKDIIAEKTSAPATRAMVAQILYNSLEVKLAEKSGEGSVRVSEKTILEDKLGYMQFKNYMVTQVDGTESIADSGLRVRAGQLVFAQLNEVFAYENVLTKTEARELLGKYVSGFYKIGADDAVSSLLFIEQSATKSTEITLRSEDIVDFSALKLEYFTDADKNDTEDLEIDANAQLMYNGTLYDYKNGTAAERNLTAWLDPDSDDFVDGEVRFVENTGDNKIDTVFIEDFETYVAKSAVQTSDTVDANNYVIYDNYVSGKSVRIDPYARNVTAEFYNAQTGAEMQIEDIKAMHIVSVAANKANTKFKVYISSKTIKGKIQERGDDGSYVIGGKVYPTTDVFEAQVTKGTVAAKIGAEGTFYLDKNDRIYTAKITVEDAGAYAYVTLAGLDNDRAILKLMNLSGTPSKPTKVKCAQSVKVNGKTETDGQKVLDALTGTAEAIKANEGVSDAEYAQLIRYVKNSADEITAITTIAMRDNEIKVANNMNMDLLVTGAEKAEYTYTSANGFAGKVFVNSSTLVLEIPDSRQDETNYKRSTATSYFKSNTKYKIAAYDINDSNVAKVVLVYNAAAVSAETAVDTATPVRIVKSVKQQISTKTEEETIVFGVEVYENGQLKTYETESMGAPFNTIKPGDALRFGFNADGQICKLGRANTGTHELDVNALTAQIKVDKYIDSNKDIKTEGGVHCFKTMFGTVSKLTSDYIFVTPTFVDTTGEEAALDVTDEEGLKLNTSVYKYRMHLKANGDVEVSLLSDLNTIVEFGDLKNANATRVFVHTYLGTLKNLIVVIDERTQP